MPAYYNFVISEITAGCEIKRKIMLRPEVVRFSYTIDIGL